MKNVEMKIEGDKLTLIVDLAQEHGPSTSGKTVVIATTGGPARTMWKNQEIMIGLNVNKAP